MSILASVLLYVCTFNGVRRSGDKKYASLRGIRKFGGRQCASDWLHLAPGPLLACLARLAKQLLLLFCGKICAFEHPSYGVYTFYVYFGIDLPGCVYFYVYSSIRLIECVHFFMTCAGLVAESTHF